MSAWWRLLVAFALLGCEDECKRAGLKKECWVTGQHTEITFIPIDGALYPMNNFVTDYECRCVDPKAKPPR